MDRVESFSFKNIHRPSSPSLRRCRGVAGEDDAGNVDPEEETVKERTQQVCHRMKVTSQVEPTKHYLGGVEYNPGQGELLLCSFLVQANPRLIGEPAVCQRPLGIALMPQCLQDMVETNRQP